MEQLRSLYATWAGEPCDKCLALGADGSSRRYYRLSGATRSCIGTIADDLRENEAFFAFTRHFRAKGMPVPELYLVADDKRHYLQQDLGDRTLYSVLFDKRRQGGGFDAEMLALYRQALADLAALQVAGRDMDFGVAYPRSDFDRRSILWDLNYFKYYFLKLAHVPFDEEMLENDFETLVARLLETDCSYFMYRDFQGRNIMVRETSHVSPLTSHLYYIDYQGGRRGAAQYDVASLLYSAKSDLPDVYRRDLLEHYLDCRGITGPEREVWKRQYALYVLIRILQTLGAYGYRGLYERKDYFLQSIPLALRNLRMLLTDGSLFDGMPHLFAVLGALVQTDLATPKEMLSGMNVTVMSFSYKQGLPQDPTENGGGHVFDCRALPNPGRYEAFRCYTGKDRPVIEFLEKEPAVDLFLSHARAIVGQSVDKYMERNFNHLLVSFGCTGGQHRSVYCAEQMATWLRQTYPSVNVRLWHRERKE